MMNVYVLEYERHMGIPSLGQRDQDGEIIGKMGVVDWIIHFNDKYRLQRTTVEDVAMNRSVFQSLNAERERLKRWDILTKGESPAGRGNKVNRIYTRLGGKFAMGKIHIRESHYALENEIVTFGPMMASNDVIDALDLACLGIYPPGKTSIDADSGRKSKERGGKRKKDWRLL